MMAPLTLSTRRDLDRWLAAATCEDCGRDAHALDIEPPCHPVSVFATYGDGEVTLHCGECGNAFVAIPVAG